MNTKKELESIKETYIMARETLDEIFFLLEQFRKSLPLFRFPLPEPFDKVFEFVEGTDWRKPHWRWRAEWKNDISKASAAQLSNLISFAKAAQKARGERGTYKLPDGREISSTAFSVMVNHPMEVEVKEKGQEDRERNLKLLGRWIMYGYSGLLR
jgi:hypothetical protein